MASMGAWGARVGRRPPPPHSKLKKSFFGYIGGLFDTFSSYGGLFATFFSFLGAFSRCGVIFATFNFMVGAFFWACPPPPYENFCGRPRLQGGFLSILPGNFLCDRNLVSSEHVLLRFRLNNEKNNDKL